MNLRKARLGGVKLTVIGVVATGLIAYAGYRVFFGRTGEAAIALIPADATCVVTLDAHPSEAQIPAFKKLSDALKREGLDNDLENGVSDIIGKAGLAKEVRQYLTKSFATAWWVSQGGKDTTGIVLLSISDPGAVSNIISTGTPVDGAGVSAYRFGSAEMVVAVIDNYLAVAKDAATISRIVRTRSGGDSIANLPEYRAARAALPGDANLMAFVAPSAFNQAMGPTGPKTTMWVSFSSSLRDGGLEFNYRGPVDSKTFPGLAELSNMAPLSHDLLKKLPPDAYGVFAYSSLDRYLRAAKSSIGKATGEKSFEKEQADFEKETGLSVEKDILPAFKGDTVLAIYPDANGSDKSADGLLLIDDANGGNPAALAEKVRAYVVRKSAEDAAKNGGPALHFVESKVGQTTVWRLDDASVREFQKSLGSKSDVKGNKTPDPMYIDKNVSYAVSKGTVVITSSNAMLTKALLAFNGDRNLAEDPAFADMALRVNEKDQAFGMVALSRILERLKPTLSDMIKSSDFTTDDLVSLFGGPNTGAVGSCHVENDTIIGSAFLPLDFDRLAKLARVLKHQPNHKDEPAIEAHSRVETGGNVSR
jgi:hypothetical protein